MSIPTFDQLMRPVLQLAAQQPITRRTATEQMIAQQELMKTSGLTIYLPMGEG